MKANTEKSKIIELSKQGLKPKEIAKKTGINPRYIYSIRSANKKAIKPLTAHERHLKKSLAEARGELYPIQAHIKKITADMVNHPPHYTAGGIETIDFIEAKKLGYNLGNVVKYITRSDLKGDRLKDLEKAQWYLTREINNQKKVTK
jgi:cell division FtsZ-interacting protein ZapD